jgi:hypothetical protein
MWHANFLKNFHFEVIQNIFEIWIYQKATFLKFWKKKSQKLFIILASHMESFILGSEWDQIFSIF